MIIVFISLALLSNTDSAKTGSIDPESGREVQLLLIRGDTGEGRSADTGLPDYNESAGTEVFSEDSLEFEKWMMEPDQWTTENN